MMKLKTFILVVVPIIQICLALTPVIPATSRLWHLENVPEFHAAFATVVGVELALVGAALIFMIRQESDDLQSGIQKLTASFPATIIQRVKDKTFYSDFKHAAENAEHVVKICYFAPYPPEEYSSKDRKKYYANMLDLMKKRPNTDFKRIVRRTEKNDPWIRELMDELKGRSNIHISLLDRDLPSSFEMPLALSVQVIDDLKVWLVATASHESEGRFRDIYIENAELAAAISDYYDRLWNLSVKVLDRGVITTEGNSLFGNSQ
jgi:hypothetical protein